MPIQQFRVLTYCLGYNGIRNSVFSTIDLDMNSLLGEFPNNIIDREMRIDSYHQRGTMNLLLGNNPIAQ